MPNHMVRTICMRCCIHGYGCLGGDDKEAVRGCHLCSLYIEEELCTHAEASGRFTDALSGSWQLCIADHCLWCVSVLGGAFCPFSRQQNTVNCTILTLIVGTHQLGTCKTQSAAIAEAKPHPAFDGNTPAVAAHQRPAYFALLACNTCMHASQHQ